MACNHWVTWLLTTWSHGKLKILYHNFYKDCNHQIWHGTIAICHEICYISIIIFLYVIHSATSTKTITTNLGGNTYQNEMATYLHVTWPNHAKVQTITTAPKVTSMKGNHLNRPHDLWFHDILTNKKCGNFYKNF